MLYVRMLFQMVISLYTSRVILNALGVEDYGIYNVVGGFVLMFTILSGSLNSAISRFITFELGTGDKDRLKKIFSSSVTIQLILSSIIIIIAETVGLWFLNYKMVIPAERMIAANWCFQLSILTFTINLISVPYNAAIIAHEKMSAFAYISILDATFKLIIAWSILISPIDRLIFYAALLAFLAVFIRMLYGLYCKKNFEECEFHLSYDHSLMKQMFSFAGWNFLGACSFQLMTLGVNLLSNLYFGVIVNAARGIATQVEHAVTVFANNFTTAVNPQITKSYASEQKDYMFSLMFGGAKLSFFLMLYLVVPLLFETKQILELWLKNVPDYTISFVRLTIIVCMISVLSNTMITAMLATGNIKKYQIIVGGLGMLVFPIVWLLFDLKFTPESAYVVIIVVDIVQLICRLYLMREMIGMSIIAFVRDVLVRVVLTCVFAFTIPFVIYYYVNESMMRFFIIVVASVLLNSLAIMSVGLNVTERQFVCKQIFKYARKFQQH